MSNAKQGLAIDPSTKLFATLCVCIIFGGLRGQLSHKIISTIGLSSLRPCVSPFSFIFRSPLIKETRLLPVGAVNLHLLQNVWYSTKRLNCTFTVSIIWRCEQSLLDRQWDCAIFSRSILSFPYFVLQTICASCLS